MKVLKFSNAYLAVTHIVSVEMYKERERVRYVWQIDITTINDRVFSETYPVDEIDAAEKRLEDVVFVLKNVLF